MAEKKTDVTQILSEIAKKFGYKLVKGESTNPIPELPKDMKNYEDMDSRQLTGELKALQGEVVKLEAQSERIKEKIAKFMNEQQPGDYNRSVFEGNRFDIRRLAIHDRQQTLTSNLRNHVDSIMKKAVEKEMTERFVGLNPEFKGVVSKLHVIDTPVGTSLAVEVGGTINEKKLEEINNEPKEKDEPAVTTSNSINKTR